MPKPLPRASGGVQQQPRRPGRDPLPSAPATDTEVVGKTHSKATSVVLGHCTVPGAQKPGVFHVSHFKVLLVDAGAEASRRDGGPVMGTGMFALPCPREALRGAGVILRGHCDGDTGDL